jgi:tetratricopeptide (TPR) repeat protein
MLELEAERQAIKAALGDLKIDAWVYESDAGARDQSTRATYLAELKAADLYIGVFWKKYGAYTIDEYQQALKWEKARLIFVKKAADIERDEPLRAFLAEIGEMDAGRAQRWFGDSDDLRELVKTDVANWQSSLVRRFTESAFVGPFQVEALSDQYVERVELLARAKASWLPRESGGAPQVTRAAFCGLPGSGKTVMARAFAHDEDVRRVFPDGVLWITLEREEKQAVDFPRLQSIWGRALRDPAMPPSGYPDKLTGAAQLRSLLQNKACLLIVDDVWEVDQVRPPFLVGGPQCLVLLTTRRVEVADDLGATALEVSPMTPAEAIALIERWCGELAPADRKIAASLADEVGYLPFALELMAAQARSLGWPAYRERWRVQKLSTLRRGRRGSGRENSVLDSFELSFNSLAKSDADLYQQLAVFGPNTQFPANAAAALWNLTQVEADDLLRDLSNQALVKRWGAGAAVRYSLHSLLHEFLLARLGTSSVAVTSLHSALVDGYRRRTPGGWPQVEDDGYFAARLAFHLFAADRADELWALIDQPWMNAQFRRGLSHASFLADIRVALQAGRQRQAVPAFVRCALVYMMVDGIVADDPENMEPALAELGELQLATSRASARSQPHRRSNAYIEIAKVLLRLDRRADALVVAEQALTAAEASDYRKAETLARVAQCLGRSGGRAAAVLEHAHVLTREMEPAERISTLAAIAEGLHECDDRAAADAVAGEMIQLFETSSAEATLPFTEATTALRTVGSVDLLERLRQVAVDLLRQGLGHGAYGLSCVAPSLVARGEIDAGIAAAELIPEELSKASTLAEIATLLAQAGNKDRAGTVFQRALELYEAECRRGESALSGAQHLLDAASLLRRVPDVAPLLRDHPNSDPIWQASDMAAMARAHHLSSTDLDRIPELASQVVNLLRVAVRQGKIHGEAIRAGTAEWLAEAGAVSEAIAIADDIDASEWQKRALASIARHLLKAGRGQDARILLMRALAVGQPPLDNQLIGVACSARGLAQTENFGDALSAIDYPLQRAADLEPGDARTRVQLSALDVLDRCGQRDRGREIAADMLRLLTGSKFVGYDLGLRSDAFYLAGKVAFEEFDAVSPSLVDWTFRRTVLRGVIKALIEAGESDRARQFFERLDADKDDYPPWAERPKADAFARMFEIADETIRQWVLMAAKSLRSSQMRSVLTARMSSTLASARDPRAGELGRSAIALAVDITDRQVRDRTLVDVANIFTRDVQHDLVLETVERVSDRGSREVVIGSAADALARLGMARAATEAVRTMDPGNVRDGWIDTIGPSLLEVGSYDEGRDLYTLLSLDPAFSRDYATARTAETLARHGQHTRAAALVEEVIPHASARNDDDAEYSLVTAHLALCLARLSRREDALQLARRASRQDASTWGPFVPATLAAAYAVAGDSAMTKTLLEETLDRLRYQAQSDLPGQIENISRTWSHSQIDAVTRLLSIVHEIADAYVRGDAIGRLANTVGTAGTLELRNALIDEASTIGEVWPRSQALQALVVPAAASKDRASLLRLLELASAIDNVWARGEVIRALASGVASIGDDDLLNRILSKTSDFSFEQWMSVAALAQTATILFTQGQHTRASSLADRALATAKTAIEADSEELAVFDAETASCFLAFGRTDEAHELIRHVVACGRGMTRAYQRRTLFEVLERSLDDINSREVLLEIAAAALGEQSTTAASVARRLAGLGLKAEAADLLQKLAAQSDGRHAADSGVLFSSARTLVRLNRKDDATRAMFDALDIGRTTGKFGQSSVYQNLAETLVELGHVEALRRMYQTLATTPKWWAH